MNTDHTPLVHKLTLLVLSLICACLVLLVVRAYQKPLPDQEPVPLAEAPPSIIAEPPSEPTPTPTAPPARRAAPQVPVRAALPSPPNPLPAPAAEPSVEFAPNPPDSSTLLVGSSFTEVHGGGVRASGGGASVGPGPELVGIVTLLGNPRPEIPIDLGPSCGRYHQEKVTTRHYVVGKAGGLANVFVYLKNAKRTPPTAEGPLLDQIGCLYEPYVMGVVAGQTFMIRNSDPELHNVHATPHANREFNFGQPLQGQVNQRSFPKPEIFVRMKCDIHPWMFAYIGVVEHPFFAVTDTNGVFLLPPGFPAGTYTVAATHVKAGELTQEISIDRGERKALQFQFSVQPNAQPQGRVVKAD